MRTVDTCLTLYLMDAFMLLAHPDKLIPDEVSWVEDSVIHDELLRRHGIGCW